ncbi:MAG: CBU_0592 family membrane protein [Thermoanaerobaculia bacterium]
MFGASNATLVGSIGVGLLLVAFFMNLFKLLRANSYPYILLNLFGGTLACLSSWMIDFMPFVVLEGTWAFVAAIALAKKLAAAPPTSREATRE